MILDEFGRPARSTTRAPIDRAVKTLFEHCLDVYTGIAAEQAESAMDEEKLWALGVLHLYDADDKPIEKPMTYNAGGKYFKFPVQGGDR